MYVLYADLIHKGREVIKTHMHKTELIRRVSRETRLPQRVVADALNTSHRLIEETLRGGETVTFPGFGTFYTSERGERTGRDIRSGKRIQIAARRVAGFRVGQLLKRAVRGERRRK